MRISDKELDRLAGIVREYATPFIEAKGYITEDEVRSILKREIGRGVCSTRSIHRIQQYMAENN